MPSKSPQPFFSLTNLAKPNPIQLLISLVAFLSLIGITTVGSAIATRTNLTDNAFMSEFYTQMVSGFALGIIGAYMIARIGLDAILKKRRVIIICSLLILLYLALPSILSFITRQSLETTTGYFRGLPIRPVIRNGAVRWLKVLFLQFQPVELVKLSTLIYFASYFGALKDKVLTWDVYKRPLYVSIVTAFAILIQPDLGSVVVIFLMLATSLFLTKINYRAIFVGALVAILLTSLIIAITPYRRERFLAWVSNREVSAQLVQDDQFLQVQKVKEAIRKGGIWGVGYGKGEVKENIPEVSSDAIIAVVFEEFGIVTVAIVMASFIALFVFCIEKGTKETRLPNAIIIIGIGSWVFYQAIWNIAGITGLVPLKGLPLPFISEGGTSIAVNFICVGFVIAALKKETR
jgi:cell division protein FtsW